MIHCSDEPGNGMTWISGGDNKETFAPTVPGLPPLTLIMGPLEQIRAEFRQLSRGSKEENQARETDENKKLEKWIDMVDRNAWRLLGLINQLLNLSTKNRMEEK